MKSEVKGERAGENEKRRHSTRMGGFRRDGTRQAQSQSFLARHSRRRPSWLGDTTGIGQGQPKREGGLPRGHRACWLDCGLCRALSLRRPLQFRIWLFSPLKLSRKRITTFISVSIAVDFHRFLFPHDFDNPIETRTPLVWIPLARVRSQTRAHRWSNALGRSTLFSWPTSRAAGVDNLGRCIDLAVRVSRSPVRVLGSKSTRGDLNRVEPRSRQARQSPRSIQWRRTGALTPPGSGVAITPPRSNQHPESKLMCVALEGFATLQIFAGRDQVPPKYRVPGEAPKAWFTVGDMTLKMGQNREARH